MAPASTASPAAPRYAQGAALARYMRLLAEERRLRPVQFHRDAAAGKYGSRLRDEAEEGIYYPQNHFPWEK